MTKVKVDVQLLVTGGVGDGKSAITHRILNAIQSDQGLQSICKLHPARSIEFRRCEQTGLSFEGELLQHAGMKAPSQTYSEVPGYPDTEKMLSYLVESVQRKKAILNFVYGKGGIQIEPGNSKILVGDAEQHTEYKPMPFYVSSTGVLATNPRYPGDRVIMLLADVGASAVGMHQDDASDTASQPAAGETFNEYTVRTATTGSGREYVASIGIPPKAEAKPTSIELTKAEIQSGFHRVRWAEGLIRQLPNNHDGRNSWLKNYGTMTADEIEIFEQDPNHVKTQIVKPTESAAPKDHAHINGAAKTLFMLIDSVADKFQPVTYEEGVYPCGLVAGNKVQVIFDDGDMVTGAVSEFAWRKGASHNDIVYWRRM